MLFGGSLTGMVSLTAKEILLRVSQEDIFLMIFETVDTANYYTNPLRNDNKAGAFFKWYNGKLWFTDFADTKISRDCFEMIKDYYNLDFNKALLYINQQFRLGLADTDEIVSPVQIEIKQSIKVKDKPDNCITYKAKGFDRHHRAYWSKFGISKQQLIEDNIHATIWYRFWSNKKQDWILIRPQASDVTFTIDQWPDAVKICRANHKGIGKWITNCSKNHVGGCESLNLAKNTLLITKSYKDWRVLTNLKLNAIWFQNEGMFPDKDKLQQLCNDFERIIIWFDNDSSGIKAANNLLQIISSFHNNCQRIYLPEELAKKQISDPADCKHKNNIFLNHFITKHFYNGQTNFR